MHACDTLQVDVTRKSQSTTNLQCIGLSAAVHPDRMHGTHAHTLNIQEAATDDEAKWLDTEVHMEETDDELSEHASDEGALCEPSYDVAPLAPESSSSSSSSAMPAAASAKAAHADTHI
jgi:hypothetical protein